MSDQGFVPQSAPVPPNSTPEEQAPPERRRKRAAALWIVPALAGLVVGAAGAGVPFGLLWSESDARVSQLEAGVAEQLDAVASAEADTSDARAEANTLRTEVKAYEQREEKMEERAAELDEREAGLDDREAEISSEEDRIAQNSFGSGTYVVGTDIQPGTYRTDGTGSLCYWARLSGGGGTFGDIIANDNVNGPTTVVISPSDWGFENSRCGTWTLVE